MMPIRFIRKKIHNSYLVWLQNSNMYIQLEEPAWFVFRKTVKRHKAETIASEFALRYGISPEESQTFVNDIRAGIQKMNKSENKTGRDDNDQVGLKTHGFEPFAIHRYCLGDQMIEFSFESRLFEHYLHPLIEHLETYEFQGRIPLFELFEYQGEIVFRLDGEVKGVWNYEEAHLAKGSIFLNLVNVMYNKTNEDWLMTVHASAITNGRKTVLFTAAPGGGKTTLAALLLGRNFTLVSDDFVPIDRNSLAYPFPIAMSIKQGSADLVSSVFPGLDQKPVSQITEEKRVRYFYPEAERKSCREGFTVKEFIFVQFDRSVEFEWNTSDRIKAIQLLLDQSWVSPSDGNPAILFDKLSEWSFYQLTYSNNQKAFDAITSLFGHDE
jgi:hypothetical protein